jgi:hypothetical protein
MTFYTGGSERVRIDTSGFVGLGASPLSNTRLTVSDTNTIKLKLTGGTAQNALAFEPVSGTNQYSIHAGNSLLAGGDKGFMIYDNTNGRAKLFCDDGTGETRILGTTFSTVYANGSERMRIDSSGNVGIGGTADATDKVTVAGNLPVSSTISISFANRGVITSATTGAARGFQSFPSTAAASFALNDLPHFWAGQNTLGAGSSVTNQYGFFVHNSVTGATNNYGFFSDIAAASNRWNFYAAGTASNFIAGRLGIGMSPETYSTYRVSIQAATGGYACLLLNDTASSPTQFIWNNAASGDNIFVQFATDAGATVRGSIDYNRAGGLTRYNTTSDYRAKTIIGPVTNSGELVDALKVYVGKMNGATVERPMLIAHEAQEVAPYAVSGEKDAVDKDGKPVYQQIDVSSLVPLLLAEVKSLRQRVAELEAK